MINKNIDERAINKKETTRRTIELYETGLTLEEVGREVGLTRQGVRYRLTAAGIALRRTKIRDDDRAFLHKHYVEEKLSVQKVAALLGVTRCVAAAKLKYHGIPVRPRGEKVGYINDFLKNLKIGAPEVLHLRAGRTTFNGIYTAAHDCGIKISVRSRAGGELLITRRE